MIDFSCKSIKHLLWKYWTCLRLVWIRWKGYTSKSCRYSKDRRSLFLEGDSTSFGGGKGGALSSSEVTD